MTQIVKKTNTEVVEVEQFKNQLKTQYQITIQNYLAGDKEKTARFMSSVINSVQRTPELLTCDRTTVMNAFMSCAEYNLYPSDISGDAYVLPYGGKATFQLGYKGIIKLSYRAGTKSITAEIVYEKDEFEYVSGLTPTLIHKPKIFEDRGEPIGAYAVATLPSGEKLFKVMSKSDIMKHKEFSKSKNSPYSPWNPKNDPGLTMWTKTVIKQLSKVLPNEDDTLARALAKENEDSRINKVEELAQTSNLNMGRFLVKNEETKENNEKETVIEAEYSEDNSSQEQ